MPKPIKYDPDKHLPIAELAAALGMTNKEIAEKCGIVESTLYEWIKLFPEFDKTIRENKEQPDKLVEKMLFRRTQGHEYTETKQFFNPEDGSKPTRVEITKKHVEPSDTAIIFWLKNRQPGKWRDRHEIDLTDNTRYNEVKEKLDKIAKEHLENYEQEGVLND